MKSKLLLQEVISAPGDDDHDHFWYAFDDGDDGNDDDDHDEHLCYHYDHDDQR